MKLSEITSSIGNLDKNFLMDTIGIQSKPYQNKENTESFSNMLKDSIEEVNQSQVNAYNAMSDIATGKVENLQEAVKRIEEAEMSLKLGLEVKNKALGAYKQVMAMQV